MAEKLTIFFSSIKKTMIVLILENNKVKIFVIRWIKKTRNLIWDVTEVKENVKGGKISDKAAVCTIPDNEEVGEEDEEDDQKITKVIISEGQVLDISSNNNNGICHVLWCQPVE